MFCGIGNPHEFENTLLKYKFTIKKKFIYPDHYQISDKDINEMKDFAKKEKLTIITTEKDAQKLKEFNELKNLPVYYLKVTIDFLWNKDKFDKKIKDYVGSYSSN